MGKSKENYETSLKDKEKMLADAEKKTNTLSKELDNLRSRFGNLEGNTSERITIKNILQSRPDITAEECNFLMVEQIDSANLTTLQNTVKEIVLAVGIPYPKLGERFRCWLSN
nr:CMF_HP1_G0006650.mRNA.1.CDS.1 [Saccharomyces cerevisiae]